MSSRNDAGDPLIVLGQTFHPCAESEGDTVHQTLWESHNFLWKNLGGIFLGTFLLSTRKIRQHFDQLNNYMN